MHHLLLKPGYLFKLYCPLNTTVSEASVQLSSLSVIWKIFFSFIGSSLCRKRNLPVLPVTSITETSVSLLITAVAVHGSLVILNKQPEYLLSISSTWHWSYRKCFRMVSKHCLKDNLDSELPSYHGYWTLFIILDMAFAWLHASPFLVLSINSKHNLCTLQWFGQSSTKITCTLHSCSQLLSAYDCTNDKCFWFFTHFSKNVFVRRNGNV